MSTTTASRCFLPALLGLLLIAGSSYAGMIKSLGSVTGGGTATVTPIITGAQNNDNATFVGGNIVVASTVVNTNQPIDIVFLVDNTDGVTEYYLAGGVSNNTGLGIIAYTFELGFGTGLDFSREPTDDGLDFDTPDEDLTPTSGQFASIVHNPDILKFSNGVIGAGLTDAFTLSIDVPDNLPGRQFTLRQLAVPVPEPTSLAVWSVLGVAGASWVRRRRKSSGHRAR